MHIGVGLGVSFNSVSANGGGGGSTTLFSDDFTRADNAAAIGGSGWTVVQGTWGIRSNQAYSVTGANNDLIMRDVGVSDYTASMDTIGDYNTNFRYGVLILSYVDANNYIFARIDSNVAELLKRVAGTSTSLTSGANTVTNNTTHNIKVTKSGNNLSLFVDGVQKGSTVTLAGADITTFAGSTKVGMRLTTSGAPVDACNFDNFLVTT